MLQDIQAGVARQAALEALAERTDVSDIRHFVVAVGQANRYGVPVADALRVQATEGRERRTARAEERAQKMSVKMLFPLIFCILPALFVVILGPGGHPDRQAPARRVAPRRTSWPVRGRDVPLGAPRHSARPIISVAGEVEPFTTRSATTPTTSELTAFYARTIRELHAADPNHLVSAGGLLQPDWPSGIDWWSIFAIPGNDVPAIQSPPGATRRSRSRRSRRSTSVWTPPRPGRRCSSTPRDLKGGPVRRPGRSARRPAQAGAGAERAGCDVLVVTWCAFLCRRRAERTQVGFPPEGRHQPAEGVLVRSVRFHHRDSRLVPS